jgi:hypothetical protein
MDNKLSEGIKLLIQSSIILFTPQLLVLIRFFRLREDC